MDPKIFYEKQISLSEWFEHSKNFDQQSFRQEDNEKRERLKILNSIINIPIEKLIQFPAIDISERKPAFLTFFKKFKDDYCALRLMSSDPKLPKLRIRGVKVAEALLWYNEQKIDPTKYRADFIRHSENELWSTIFIIGNKGIYGEVISGKHYQLTQGLYNGRPPILFSYDFKKIILSRYDLEVYKLIKEIVSHLKVANTKKRRILTDKLNASFKNYYLEGYFETIKTKEYGLMFVDYNRLLGKKYSDFSFESYYKSHLNMKHDKFIQGYPAAKGIAKGKVKIIDIKYRQRRVFENGDILVCEMTTPDYIKYFKKAAAVVTDKGGILSHAAIVAREFGIPCVVATGNATKILNNNDLVEVNGLTGIIRILTQRKANNLYAE